MRLSHWLGESIRVFDAEIYYEKHGSGEPLVCLHNFSGNSRDRFARLLPMLTKQFECYLVDLRGHGRSTNPTNTWTKEQFSRDIIEFCKQIGLGSAFFLAVSSGAMTMLRVARYAPGLIRSMVLDSGTYIIPEASRRFYKPPELLKPSLKELYSKGNEIYGSVYGKVMAQAFYDFRLPESDINIPIEWLAEITTPTLILHGDRDVFFPVDIPVAMKRAMPNSALSVFPKTEHIVMEFYPQQVAEMTSTFLKR